MGGPTDFDRGLLHVQIDDPRFLLWAKNQGTPINRGTPYGEVIELLAQYEYELREEKRRADERRKRAKEEAEAEAALKGPFPPLIGGAKSRDEDQRLRDRIRAGWGSGDPSLKRAAEKDVNNAVPLKRLLYHSHGMDRDEDRWTYLRHYLNALQSGFGAGPPTEEKLLDEVVRQEKLYQAEMKRRADELARSRRPMLQLEALRAWARKQPMNPADDFEPGIAYYNLGTASRKPQWVDADIKSISQEGYVTTITYNSGKPLRFSAKMLDFEGKYERSVVEVFARRHKASGRLVPFALYAPDVDLYAGMPRADALSNRDRALMALPYMLTPAVLAYYSQDPYWQVATGLLDVLKLMALQRGALMSAPTVAGGLSSAYQLGARGVGLGRLAAAEVSFAVRTFGPTAQAVTYLGRSAYTYYLRNAVALNTATVAGAEIGLSFTGQDMGPMSPGDTVSMAVQMDDVAAAGAKGWKLIRAEVAEVAQGTAVLRVTQVDSIADDVAKAEYDLGKKISGEAKAARTARGLDDTATHAKATRAPSVAPKTPRPPTVPAGAVAKGKGKIKLAPDPRQNVALAEIEDAMKTVAKGLDRLGNKYSAQALDRIRNLSADAIRESGIRPSDFAKLANSLSRAGATTRKFVNDFHEVPGFERVLLNWAKRHYWNTKLKKPAWTATRSFYNGTSYVMKYATRKLDPKHVRFEWPVSITDTRWGDEVFARHVDIVVTGGSTLKPGQQIQMELKSWTEFVLKAKGRSAPGKSTTYPGTIGYQLLRDTALFQPENIRWVFDGSKVTKSKVIAVFEKIIMDDDYLRAQWGGKDARPEKLRELLDKVIEVF